MRQVACDHGGMNEADRQPEPRFAQQRRRYTYRATGRYSCWAAINAGGEGSVTNVESEISRDQDCLLSVEYRDATIDVSTRIGSCLVEDSSPAPSRRAVWAAVYFLRPRYNVNARADGQGGTVAAGLVTVSAWRYGLLSAKEDYLVAAEKLKADVVQQRPSFEVPPAHSTTFHGSSNASQA